MPRLPFYFSAPPPRRRYHATLLRHAALLPLPLLLADAADTGIRYAAIIISLRLDDATSKIRFIFCLRFTLAILMILRCHAIATLLMPPLFDMLPLTP